MPLNLLEKSLLFKILAGGHLNVAHGSQDFRTGALVTIVAGYLEQSNYCINIPSSAFPIQKH